MDYVMIITPIVCGASLALIYNLAKKLREAQETVLDLQLKLCDHLSQNRIHEGIKALENKERIDDLYRLWLIKS